MATTAGGTPYVESSDLVANYPAVSLALAEHVDDVTKVLQIVSSTTTTGTSTTSSSFVGTDLTATITPQFNTSKILIFASGVLLRAGATQAVLTIARNGVDLDGSTWGFARAFHVTSGNLIVPFSVSHSDSPASTSAMEYKATLRSQDGTNSVTMSPNSAKSQIILMEISA